MRKSLEMVDPLVIKVSNDYQRKLDYNRVRRIVKDWDDNLVNFIKVSRRPNGDVYVVDGQHTLEAWKEKKGQLPMKAVVFEGLSEEEEATLFSKTNSCAKPVSYNEKLRATLFSKSDEKVNQYFSLLDSIEVPYLFTTGEHDELTAHKSYLELFDADKETLKKTLVSMKNCFCHSENYCKYDVRVASGIFMFLSTFQNKQRFSYYRLCDVLSKTTPKIINSKAAIKADGYLQKVGGKNRGKYVALVLTDMYNAKLQANNRLDPSEILFKDK